ncbi:MAG: 50S ribosomal protein L4 [archaeon]|nr:50S ribosomal protein L4 [archaeon]
MATHLLRTVTRPGGLACASLSGPALLSPPMLRAPLLTLATLNDEEGSREVDLEPSVFGAQVRPDLLHRAVRFHRNSMRQGTAMAKNRAEVAHSTRKVRPQKGTGASRTGDSRMPHWVGGGVAHPPRPRDFSHDLPRQVRQQALRVALSARFADQRLGVLEDLTVASGKTRELARVLRDTGVLQLKATGLPELGAPTLPDRVSRLLFVGDVDELDAAENFKLACGNLKFVSLINRFDLCTYALLYHDRVFLTERIAKQLNVMYKREN